MCNKQLKTKKKGGGEEKGGPYYKNKNKCSSRKNLVFLQWASLAHLCQQTWPNPTLFLSFLTTYTNKNKLNCSEWVRLGQNNNFSNEKLPSYSPEAFATPLKLVARKYWSGLNLESQCLPDIECKRGLELDLGLIWIRFWPVGYQGRFWIFTEILQGPYLVLVLHIRPMIFRALTMTANSTWKKKNYYKI